MEIKKILIANRGEIALRVISTAREMGIKTVTVYTEPEIDYPHAYSADESYSLGSGPLSQTYLNQELILKIAKEAKCDAIHPGYGFLSENSKFVRMVEKSGLIFIGPSADTMETMGDKIGCKLKIEKWEIPLIPGYNGENQDPKYLEKHATEIGVPLLIKASAGGGGKGMRLVRNLNDFQASLEGAKREALAAFSDDRVLLEKYIEEPRHIEVQVMGDTHGNFLHFFERECSIQRRHQKIIEETPAYNLPKALRDKITGAAVTLIKRLNYRGAGTVEFILAPNGEFYFLEMNTRLQVEHPITEKVTQADLVRLQILVAQGEKLPLSQNDIFQRGHAIETRIYAENPDAGFLPCVGKIQHIGFPSLKNVRLDCGFREGNEVTINFDPMLAKLISFGADRNIAIDKMLYSLDEITFVGVKSNREYLKRIIGSVEFKEGIISTNFVEKYKEILKPKPLTSEQKALAVAALLLQDKKTEGTPESSPWDSLKNFRNI
jgi:3-methylcrotonyl-CoA carboxylase alpha subunit